MYYSTSTDPQCTHLELSNFSFLSCYSSSSVTASGVAAAGPGANPGGGSKSSQFRWRRRKRRSKAQYPEMGRYLLPIDQGDEIQHLGRTLECQLCGLRGKR